MSPDLQPPSLSPRAPAYPYFLWVYPLQSHWSMTQGLEFPGGGGGSKVSKPGFMTLLPVPVCRKRRGAINSKQLTYLEKYRPKQRLRFKDPHTHKTRCCVM